MDFVICYSTTDNKHLFHFLQQECTYTKVNIIKLDEILPQPLVFTSRMPFQFCLWICRKITLLTGKRDHVVMHFFVSIQTRPISSHIHTLTTWKLDTLMLRGHVSCQLGWCWRCILTVITRKTKIFVFVLFVLRQTCRIGCNIITLLTGKWIILFLQRVLHRPVVSGIAQISTQFCTAVRFQACKYVWVMGIASFNKLFSIWHQMV